MSILKHLAYEDILKVEVKGDVLIFMNGLDESKAVVATDDEVFDLCFCLRIKESIDFDIEFSELTQVTFLYHDNLWFVTNNISKHYTILDHHEVLELEQELQQLRKQLVTTDLSTE